MENIIEERVIIEGETNIGATISYLDKTKNQPLVLLIMGTGKANRDGNMRGFKTNIYKDLSDIFVGTGCVCIRYDKRGTHESSGNFGTAGLSDLVRDSASVIEYAKSLDYVDSNKIIVCGHSEGAMIATLLTEHQKLERLILLGGAAMCLKTALIYQNNSVIKEFENKKGFLAWYMKKMLKKNKIEDQVNSFFERAKTAKRDKYFYRGAFINTKWMKEHGELTDESYIDIIKNYDGKVLAITGTADLNADYNQLDRINEFENVTTYAPKNVNHILKTIDDDNSYLTIKKQYGRLAKEPINKDVKDYITEFIEM